MRTLIIFLLLFCPLSLSAQDQQVKEHSLVKIVAPPNGKFTDVLVIGSNKGQVVFVPVEELKGQEAGNHTFVFTGAPGSYQIRISQYSEERGLRVTTQTVTITKGAPGPDPDPDPGPLPPDDEFGNVGQTVHLEMIVRCSPTFPRKELKEAYQNVAARLKGTKQPIIGTLRQSTTELKKEQDRILSTQHAEEWRAVAIEINKHFKQHAEQMDRAKLTRFMEAVASGITL